MGKVRPGSTFKETGSTTTGLVKRDWTRLALSPGRAVCSCQVPCLFLTARCALES